VRGLGLKLAVFPILAAVAVASAQSRPIPPAGPPQQITHIPGRSSLNAKSAIRGTVIDSTHSPVPNAAVRLRNLQTNQIEQISTANRMGEFGFTAEPETPYVVEIADQTGQIVAVGDVVVAQAGDVAGATVAVPTRLPGFAGVFSQTAGSVVSAATSTGISVVEGFRAAAVPVSPEH
jgi:Carboxypeptidase regulatory-like domain